MQLPNPGHDAQRQPGHGPGRVGKVILRTWKTAHKMKTQRSSLLEDSSRNDNFRAKR